MDDLLPVAEYQIDRGRAYELDRVDTGRATSSCTTSKACSTRRTRAALTSARSSR